MKKLDKAIATLVGEHGIDQVIAALARHANERGMPVIFRRLNKLYEWLKS